MYHTNSEQTPSWRDFAASSFLVVEGLILLGITFAYWFHIDPTQSLRDGWFWLLWLALPIFGLRLHLFGRLWTHTRLHDLLLVFIMIAALNYNTALYQRESFLASMARPLSGMWTLIYFVELARHRRSLKLPVIFTVGMSLVLAILALTASQWTSKTALLEPILTLLPEFDYQMAWPFLNQRICSPLIDLVHVSPCFNPALIVRNTMWSFNVNEIAGALTWTTPLLIGLALMASGKRSAPEAFGSNRVRMGIRIGAGITGLLSFLALFLGQSRFAIGGTLVALTVMALIGVSQRMRRGIMLGLIIIIALIQMGILLNLFAPTPTENPSAGLSARDESSIESRLQIWQMSLQIMGDYPASGAGMYMFRTAVNRDPYIIPYFDVPERSQPPHAHNEWLNIGAEMGLSGLIIFVAWQAIVLWMLWVSWREGDHIIRTVAMAVFCALLAHGLYGLGDTIALWDRFQFILWWLVGLACAQYVLVRLRLEADLTDASPARIR